METLSFIRSSHNDPEYCISQIQIIFWFLVNLSICKIYSRPVLRGILWLSIAFNSIDVPLNRIIAGGTELKMSVRWKVLLTLAFCTNTIQNQAWMYIWIYNKTCVWIYDSVWDKLNTKIVWYKTSTCRSWTGMVEILYATILMFINFQSN